MKKVEFVQIKSSIWGVGLVKGAHYVFPGIEETVRQWVSDGWEYKGWLPIETRGTGDLETISLIFQMDE